MRKSEVIDRPIESARAAVEVRNLGMTYQAPVRETGLRAALRSVVHREYRDIDAVAEMSFELRAGEVVGFIGPNGAGKTTTMKILSGILHPTAGEVCVLGYVPWRRQNEYLKKIALVRGSQPIGGPAELTVMDSLRYQQLLYDMPTKDFRNTLDELVGMLELESLLGRQVRALSLGERMRAGLATTLVYRPRVLFLDEPTLGLDVSAAATLRRFIADYAVRMGATVLLTSHYMADVESLCRRVILIDRSKIRYDGPLGSLAARLSPYKLIKVSVADATSIAWERYGELEGEGDGRSSAEHPSDGRSGAGHPSDSRSGAEHPSDRRSGSGQRADGRSGPSQVALRVGRGDVPRVTSELLGKLAVVDLAVEEPPLDLVMDRFYREGKAE